MRKTGAITEAIREALIALRDPEASVSDTRAKILELHSELKEEVAARTFSARLGVQRNWARKELGGRRAARKKSQGTGALERYQIAERFFALCGGHTSHAEEVLGFLEKIETAELRQAYEGWQQLIATAGNAQKARQILATMRDSGMI